MWSAKLEDNIDMFTYIASYAKKDDGKKVKQLCSTDTLRDSIAKNTFPKNGYEVLFAPYWSKEAEKSFKKLVEKINPKQTVTQDIVKNWCKDNGIMQNAEHFVPIIYVCHALIGLSYQDLLTAITNTFIFFIA